MKGLAKVSAAAIALAVGLAMAGCGTNNTNSGGSGSSDTPVKMTFWHNGTGDKAQAYWADVIKAFNDKYPNVTVTAEVVQNEELDGKLQTAMLANTAPDVFLQRGGGKLQDMINANQVKDITSLIDPAVKTAMGGAFTTGTIGGKIYAMPMSVTPEGLWYSKDLFAQAGITTLPTDMASLNEAVTKLRAIGVAPIAVGAADAWPAAHWFYSFALRECSQSTIENLATDKEWKDPCWLKALQDVADLNATNPWQDGVLTTVGQKGAGSSAGLIANHKAGMELMGAWQPGVIGDLTPDLKPLPDLGWFPFPAVPGGQGAPTAMMGGSDGYSCSAKAPQPACADFLNFMGSKQWSEGYATAYTTIPANKDASSVVTDPSLIDATKAYSQAAYVTLWIDTSLGQDTGNAVNQQVVNILAGQATPESALAAIQAALKAA